MFRARSLARSFSPTESDEVVIVAAPSVVAAARPSNASTLSNPSSTNVAPLRPPDDSVLVSEIRTLKKQQEELLAAVSGLRTAVESGMRTLNGRVRALEEQMQEPKRRSGGWLPPLMRLIAPGGARGGSRGQPALWGKAVLERSGGSSKRRIIRRCGARASDRESKNMSRGDR